MTPYQPEIRFADIDAMGHVNNAVYFSYFEQARMHFFNELAGGEKWDWNTDGVLVAHHDIDYKRPILLNDKIQILTKCPQIGEKSFTISYEVKRGEELCAIGSSVMVCYNYKEQRTQAVPEAWRKMLAAL